jgi:flavin-dependent dehydrogenase
MPGCPIEYGKGKVLFAGETAGFLNPMGEGISAGMESGYAAAKAIEKIDLNSDFDIAELYAFYQSNTYTLKNYMERQWNFVADMASTFEFMRV